MDSFALPFATTLIIASLLTAAVDAWERFRLAHSAGPFAAADFGGLILLVSLVAGLGAYHYFEASSVLSSLSPERILGPLLFVAALLFVFSAVTDQCPRLRGLRFFLAFSGGLYLARLGLSISTVKIPFHATYMPLGLWGPVLSALWLVLSASLFARANALPRVPLGVGALSAGTLYIICLLQPSITGPHTRLFTACLFAALLPMTLLPRYLTHGGASAGAYLIGFLIGAASVMGALKHTAALVALLPLMIIGVPLFSTAYSWLADLVRGQHKQFWRRRHPHLHEILLQQGYSSRQVVAIVLIGTGILCVFSLLLVLGIELNFAIKLGLTLFVVAFTLIALYVLLRLMKPAYRPPGPEAVHLLGVRVDRVTMEEAMQRVEQFMRENTPHMIVTSDTIGLMRAQDDPELRTIINEADLVTADGAGVILSARLLNLPLDVRVSGCDMVGEICKVAARLGRSVYLLGAAPGVAEKAAENLQKMAPGLKIAGCHHGYFTPEEEPEIIAEIAARHPGALFVALGIPRQEKWIKAHMQELGVPVCIGVGGSFDVISGLKKRAPRWMQRCGLEWLYRVLKEPSRLPRLTALPRLLWLTFAYLLRPPKESVLMCGEEGQFYPAPDKQDSRIS